MNRADVLLRASGVVLALALTFAAVAVGWAQTTRSTPTGAGLVVLRENLWTGAAEFCSPVVRSDPATAACVPVTREARPDFSDRASPVGKQS